MFIRFQILLLILSLRLAAQQGDVVGQAMNSVVAGSQIPASPVLSVEDSLKSFQLPPGFVIEPVAAEPLIDKPVCLDFDSTGRMWICEMRDYMPDIDGKGESVAAGRIVILEDTDHDGRFDKRTVFLDKIHLPRALAVFEDGLLFIDEHRLCWVKRDGNLAVGDLQQLPSNFAESGNVEHKPNGLLANLDNCYYLAKSDKRIRRTSDGWVIEPTEFRGQWGIARDDFGRLYHNNNSTLLFGDLLVPNLLQGNPGVKIKTKDFVQLGSDRVWPSRVTPGVNRGYVAKSNGFDSDTLDPQTYKLKSTTAAAGMAIYRGTNFPKEWYGTGFIAESVSNLVKATRINDSNGALNGSHPLGKVDFLTSTDERFRPVNVYNAPDGSLYVVDMYHGVIQHKTYMTTYLRNQILSRGLDVPGSGCGRIYRIRHVAGSLESVREIRSLLTGDLVRLLAGANAWQREAAQRLLVSRKDSAALPLLAAMANEGAPLARIHAIWTLDGMGQLRADHLASSVRCTDAKLQSSALWASTRLSGSELSAMEPVLLVVNPVADEVVPYLMRALGPLGTARGFDRMGELLKSHGSVPFVREALVSGLNHHELEFRDSKLRDSHDTQLLAWLEKGSADANRSFQNVSPLKGDDLASYRRGKALFHGEAACFGCHSADGSGIANLGPPLDESEWVTGKSATLINILLHGLVGPVVVDGEMYEPSAAMPGLSMNPAFKDQSIADIATYIRNEWSNHASAVPAEFVKSQRELTRSRAGRSWTAGELKE